MARWKGLCALKTYDPQNGSPSLLVINFLPGGNANKFTRVGWSFQEPGGIWTIGGQSTLLVPDIPSVKRLDLSLSLMPYINEPSIPHQKIELIFNGISIYRGKLGPRDRNIICEVPAAALRSGSTNSLIIEHPDSVAPRDLSLNKSDTRRLALFISQIKLDWVSEINQSKQTGSKSSLRNERRLILTAPTPVSVEISQILEFFPPFESQFELRLQKNLEASVPERDRGRLFSIWEPVLSTQANLQIPKPKDNITLDVQRIRFPVPTINCLWPLQGYDPQLMPEPLYPNGKYRITDVAAVKLRGRPLDDERLYSTYLQISAEMLPDLEESYQKDQSVWQSLDALCDVKVSDFIVSKFPKQRMFYGPTNFSATFLIYLTEHLLSSLLPKSSMDISRVFREFVNYTKGYQGMFLDQEPINPFVLKHFPIENLDANYEYRRGHSKRTFMQHILDYIGWLDWFA